MFHSKTEKQVQVDLFALSTLFKTRKNTLSRISVRKQEKQQICSHKVENLLARNSYSAESHSENYSVL